MYTLVGSKLNSVRKEKGMTLKELSALTDISVSLLSNIERDQRSPTIIEIQKICDALDIMLSDLFSQKDVVFSVKKSDRKLTFSQDNKTNLVSYYSMTEVERELTCMSMEIKGDENEFKSYRHKFDELGIVAQGVLQVSMMSETYTLYEGDTIYIPAHCIHSFKKLGSEDCVSYWITSYKREM